MPISPTAGSIRCPNPNCDTVTGHHTSQKAMKECVAAHKAAQRSKQPGSKSKASTIVTERNPKQASDEPTDFFPKTTGDVINAYRRRLNKAEISPSGFVHVIEARPYALNVSVKDLPQGGATVSVFDTRVGEQYIMNFSKKDLELIKDGEPGEVALKLQAKVEDAEFYEYETLEAITQAVWDLDAQMVTTQCVPGTDYVTAVVGSALNRDDIQHMVPPSEIAIKEAIDAATGPKPVPFDDWYQTFSASVSGAQPTGKVLVTESGKLYYSRILDIAEGKTEEELLRGFRSAGTHPLIGGPPGTGKSAGPRAVFTKTDKDGRRYAEHTFMLATASTEPQDIIGGFQPNGEGGFKWVDGPLVEAMRNGTPCIVDEIGALKMSSQVAFYSAMDQSGTYGRGSIKLDNGEVVNAKPGFIVIGTYNPEVIGMRIAPPMESRSIPVEWNTDWTNAGSMDVHPRFIDAVTKMTEEIARRKEADPEGQYDLRGPEMRDALKFRDMAAVLGATAAFDILMKSLPSDESRQMFYRYAESCGCPPFGKPDPVSAIDRRYYEWVKPEPEPANDPSPPWNQFAT